MRDLKLLLYVLAEPLLLLACGALLAWALT